MLSADHSGARLGTRLSFLVAGFGIACWAPLVPFIKQKLQVDDQVLGTLLLCIGIGSVASMMLTGALISRHGSKPVITISGFALAVVLPLLPLARTSSELAFGLLALGASLGSLDVAMNIHAAEVERMAKRPLMSGFHGLFSVGGLAGSGLMTFLLSRHLGTAESAILCAVLMAVAMIAAAPRLLQEKTASGGTSFAMPHGLVFILAALAAITFLVEGALLDWSALLITDLGLVNVTHGGLGYMLFSCAMTVGRLGGDAVTARAGDRAILLWGGLLTIAGFVVLLAVPAAVLALSGFVLIGLGASNIVPVLFRRAATQKVMPAGLAVAAITTTGYGGILAGPAAVGFVAKAVGLGTAFWMLAALFGLVPMFAHLVARSRT
jgi:predicted MFS family arabinose efflux permease